MYVRPVVRVVFVACAMIGVRFIAAADKPAKLAYSMIGTSDGVELYCEFCGEGETALLFLHGWCGTHDYWQHQQDVFAKDYRVVAIDQAGHGQSGKQRQEWTIERLGADVESVVQALKLKRVILIGHSMGGPVSLAAARRLPGTVVGIIGVDTLHNVEFVWNAEESNGFLTGLKQDFPGTLRDGLKGLNRDDVDPDLLKRLTEDAVTQYPTMALGLMTDMTGLNEKQLMSEVKVPIRCINCAPTFPFALKTESEINRKYADYDAVIMDDVGHYPMLEKPEEFNKHLAETLKKLAQN